MTRAEFKKNRNYETNVFFAEIPKAIIQFLKIKQGIKNNIQKIRFDMETFSCSCFNICMWKIITKYVGSSGSKDPYLKLIATVIS